MKKLLTGLFILASISAFAGDQIKSISKATALTASSVDVTLTVECFDAGDDYDGEVNMICFQGNIGSLIEKNIEGATVLSVKPVSKKAKQIFADADQVEEGKHEITVRATILK